MKSSSNYKTLYIGTPKKLEECSYIYLVNSGKLGTRISLDNLGGIREKIVEIKKLEEDQEKKDSIIGAGKEDESFKIDFTPKIQEYELRGENYNFKFDLILYCTGDLDSIGDDDSIVGFTLFSSPQRCYSVSGSSFKALKISVIFSKPHGDGSETFIVTLKNTRKSDLQNEPLTGEEDYNYPDNNSYLNISKSHYLRFTNKLNDFFLDDTLGMITDFGFNYHKDDRPYVGGFYIFPEINLETDIYGESKIGLYENDLVVFRLNRETGEFCISSLTQKNVFGNPYDHISGFIETSILTEYHKLTEYNNGILIFRYENRNNTKQEYIVYFLEKNEYLIYPMTDFGVSGVRYLVLDQWNPRDNFRYISESELILEVTRTCFTPKGFDKDYRYLEKKGEWWIFQLNEIYYYISTYGYFKSDIKLIPVNDKILMCPIEEGLYGLYYQFLVLEDFGNTYSYIDGELRNELNPDDECFNVYFKAIKQASLEKDINCFLDGLRKTPLKSLPTEMSEFECILGIIFFKDQKGYLHCY